MKQTLYIIPCLKDYTIEPRGILHVGAGNLEEAEEYLEYGFNQVVWVDALTEKAADLNGALLITKALDWSIKEAVEFRVASNGSSSSLLKFGSHAEFYPEVTEEKVILLDTTTG